MCARTWGLSGEKPPRSGSVALRQLNPIHKKGVFLWLLKALEQEHSSKGGSYLLQFGNKGGNEIFFLERWGWTKGGEVV